MQTRRFTLLIALFILTGIATQSWASRVLPLNLETITKSAALIFEGACVNVKSGTDPETGHPATWYTFKVYDVFKGESGETHTFKQYGQTNPEVDSVSMLTHYEEDERVILFLYGESSKGFTSAVGLHQGKFNIAKVEDSDLTLVSNGMPATVLFKEMNQSIPMRNAKGYAIQGAEAAQMDIMAKDEFLDIVTDLVKKESLKKQ